MNRKFGMLKGLSNVNIVEITDTPEAYAMADSQVPQQLIPAGTLTVSKSVDKAQYYFDNNMFAEVGREAPSDMTLEGSAVCAALLAYLEGKDVDSTTKAILDDGDWHSKFFAISGQKDYLDGTSELFWFLKCSFGGSEESATSIDDSTDAAGNSLPFTAYSTIHKFASTGKHQKVVRIDTADTQVKTSQDFFAQVVNPDNISTIVEAIPDPVTPVPDDGE